MRHVPSLLCLSIALAAAPASAQPTAARTPGWREAISAALAFGYAESRMAALANYTIAAAPRTKKAADALLDALDKTAQQARDAYALVESRGSPVWSVAAKVRIGDAYFCQAEKIATIPVPPQIAPSLPPQVLAQYVAVLRGLAAPLEEEGARLWTDAARSDASPFWTGRARDRLAGGPVPGC